MTMHHVKFENKLHVLKSIFQSIKPGGEFIIVDFFLKREVGIKFTDAGQKGPEECRGYGQKIDDFLLLCKKAGFLVDEFYKKSKSQESFFNSNKFNNAVIDVSKTIQINKNIWFTILSK